MKILRWCAFDRNFLPNSSDTRFKAWVGSGITAYCTLIHKGVLKSFDTVKREYNFEQQDFYRYLQIRHYVGTITKDMDVANLEKAMMKIFVTAYKAGNNNKIISRIYNCFMNRKAEGRVIIFSPLRTGMGYVGHSPKLCALYPGGNFVGRVWFDSSSPPIRNGK